VREWTWYEWKAQSFRVSIHKDVEIVIYKRSQTHFIEISELVVSRIISLSASLQDLIGY